MQPYMKANGYNGMCLLEGDEDMTFSLGSEKRIKVLAGAGVTETLMTVISQALSRSGTKNIDIDFLSMEIATVMEVEVLPRVSRTIFSFLEKKKATCRVKDQKMRWVQWWWFDREIVEEGNNWKFGEHVFDNDKDVKANQPVCQVPF